MNSVPDEEQETRQTLGEVATSATNYSGLDDGGFLEELQQHLEGRSWSLGHLLEWRQRGVPAPDSGGKLAKALNEEWEHQSAMWFRELLTEPHQRDLLEQERRRWSKVAEDLGLQVAVPEGLLSEALLAKEMEGLNLGLGDALDWAALQPSLIAELSGPVAGLALPDLAKLFAEDDGQKLKVQTAQLRTPVLLEQALKRPKRDRVDYLVIVAVVAAAVSGVWSLALALL